MSSSKQGLEPPQSRSASSERGKVSQSLNLPADLAGTPHNSQYNTPNDTPSGSQASGSPFKPPAHLLQSSSASRDVSGADGQPQVQ